MSINSLQVPFGLRDGRLYEPLQVESGLKCGCTCPGCGAALVARHSPSGKVVSHFAHKPGADCATGFETSVHLAAKQLIADRRAVFLPVVRAQASGIGPSGRTYSGNTLLHPAGLVSLSHVRVEAALGNIRPDLLVVQKRQEVLIEIAVTHFVDEEKLARIKVLELPAVEIDVSELREVNFAALESALFSDSQRSRWVWHPAREREQARLQSLVDEELAQDKLEWASKEAADRRERAYQQVLVEKAEAALRAKEAADRKRVALFSSAALPEKLRMVLARMKTDEATVAEFLPMPVRAPQVVAAPLFVWQAAVFSGLIHGAIRRGRYELSGEECRAWLRTRFKVSADEKALGVAVWDFLCGLEGLGILHRIRQQQFLVAVPGLAGALALVADARDDGVLPLVWTDRWPSMEGAIGLAEVFQKIYGARAWWVRLAGLLPMVRRQEGPETLMQEYLQDASGAVEGAALRRYFLAVGFVRLAGR